MKDACFGIKTTAVDVNSCYVRAYVVYFSLFWKLNMLQKICYNYKKKEMLQSTSFLGNVGS